MLHRRLVGVLNFYPHHISNAAAEGLNARIQAIKSMARGFRNREHFKTAIYFHWGGLNLYPETHAIPRSASSFSV
jgi:transposase